jgi:cyclic di-GMP phosphodiesterase Gmr
MIWRSRFQQCWNVVTRHRPRSRGSGWVQRFDDHGDAICVFSTDRFMVGQTSSIKVPAATLFGPACGPEMIEHEAVSSIYGSLTSGYGNATVAYLPIERGKHRFLLLLADGPGGKPIRIETDQLPAITTLLGCARMTEMLHESVRKQADLEQRVEYLQAREDELNFNANHDDLTGLPNRGFTKTLVENRLSQRGLEGRLALAFVDLDDFKRVNDTYGHIVGDELLRKVAERLRAGIRDSDICGRIGGDEFIICVDDPLRSIDAEGIFSRISNALRQPFEIEGRQISCSASVGVALFPQNGTDFKTLLRSADGAMYRAKKHRNGSVVIEE